MSPREFPIARVAWPAAVRIIRSAFPPIDLFEDIADPADWPLLILAEMKTNPRLMETIGNLDLVPPSRRVSGAGASWLMAPFTELTDRYLPPLQEALLEMDPRIVFCAAVDNNGYLPTHNLKFSHPQGPDPVWNAANCRNRRLFNDRTGPSAGANTRAFLLQTYRRDMGGGVFAMMKDASAPIFVNGRHWGGFRMGYRV